MFDEAAPDVHLVVAAEGHVAGTAVQFVSQTNGHDGHKPGVNVVINVCVNF
jgi:hypothetical protein